MPFLTFSNAIIQFIEKELTGRSYTAAEVLLTIKQVELIDKKEFAKAALDEVSKTFVVHIVALQSSARSAEMTMHLSQAAQITAWKQNEAPTKILSKYANYADIFSFDLAMELPKNVAISKHAIELQDGKQPSYKPIFSLGLWSWRPLRFTLKLIWEPGLFDLLNLLQVLSFYLIKSQTKAFGCVLIIEVSITSQSKIDTHYCLLRRL